MMNELITDTSQVTPVWLTTVLQRAGALKTGCVTRVEQDTRQLAYGSFVSRLALRFSDDAPDSAPANLFLKVNPREAQFGIPGLGKKEPEFYNAVADSMGQLPVVPCYSAVYSPAQGSYHLLLADLTETHAAFPPSQFPPAAGHCEMIVDALADLHAYWWNHPKLGNPTGERPTEAALKAEVDGYAALLPKFFDFMQDRLSPGRMQVQERVLSGLLPLLLRRLAPGKALTLIFEDVHAGNFLYPHDPQRHRLYIIDWEQWGVNVGPHDLAYMMAMFWFPERRVRMERPLLQRYHQRLQQGGVEGYTWDDCWQDYRLSALRLLFHPAWQWEHGGQPDIWFNHLERLHLAIEDLRCEELFR